MSLFTNGGGCDIHQPIRSPKSHHISRTIDILKVSSRRKLEKVFGLFVDELHARTDELGIAFRQDCGVKMTFSNEIHQ
jgi:hypothetical protein